MEQDADACDVEFDSSVELDRDPVDVVKRTVLEPLLAEVVLVGPGEPVLVEPVEVSIVATAADVVVLDGLLDEVSWVDVDEVGIDDEELDPGLAVR
jgi:hypothetical protein